MNENEILVTAKLIGLEVGFNSALEVTWVRTTPMNAIVESVHCVSPRCTGYRAYQALPPDAITEVFLVRHDIGDRLSVWVGQCLRCGVCYYCGKQR